MLCITYNKESIIWNNKSLRRNDICNRSSNIQICKFFGKCKILKE